MSKFFHFYQNNSEGMFITSDEHGINKYVVIESDSLESAWQKLQSIGSNVVGFNDMCSCCGPRWNIEDCEIADFPHVWGAELNDFDLDHDGDIFVHYLNGSIRRFDV